MTRKSDKKRRNWAERWSRASRPLLHPAWLAALLFLVLNDHLLKHAGVLPGWLTGKLSDFAGMVVAPVLLVALLGLRRRGFRIAALVSVAAVFGAINVSPLAARLLERATAWVGVPWHIVVDPSDLIAFAALPIAWVLIKQADAAIDSHPPATRWNAYARSALALTACVACVATSGPNGTSNWFTSGYLVNDTGALLNVRVRRYDGQLDCDTMAAFPERLLAKSAFGEAATFALAASDTLPLDFAALNAAAGWQNQLGNNSGTFSGPQVGCQLALIEADGMPATVVWWMQGDVALLSVPNNAQSQDFKDRQEDLRDGRIDIVINNLAALEIHARGNIQQLQPIDPIEASDCSAPGTPVQWSDTSALAGLVGPEWLLQAVTPLPGGCYDLSLVDLITGGDGEGGMGQGGMGQGGMGQGGMEVDGSDAEHVFLCVPEGSFPFAAGDILSFPSTGNANVLQIVADDFDELRVVAGANDLSELGLDGQLGVTECNGIRSECDAFVFPAGVSVEGVGEVAAGESIALPPSANRSRQLFVGHAQQVMAAPTACGPDITLSSLSADLVLLYTVENSL